MTDLRALLGDKHDEVLTKATKRALFNYPNLPISIPEHEALAAHALAAVLPDLLADVWDEGHADGLGDAVEYREHRKLRNPYRPEPAAGRPEPAPGPANSPNPTPSATQPPTEPHNTEGAAHDRPS